jgi:hypothetical protein
MNRNEKCDKTSGTVAPGKTGQNHGSPHTVQPFSQLRYYSVCTEYISLKTYAHVKQLLFSEFHMAYYNWDI